MNRITTRCSLCVVFLACLGDSAHAYNKTRTWTYAASQANFRIDEQKRALEDAESKMLHSIDSHFQRISEAIDSIYHDDFHGERIAMKELGKIAAILQELTRDVIEGHEAFKSAATDYRDALVDSHPAFIKAAAEYRSYAESEPFDDLAKSYRQQAEILLATAKKIELAARQIGPSYRNIKEDLAYVKRVDLFLERFQSFTAVFPEDLTADKLFADLQTHVRAFERFRELIQEFHGKVTSQTPLSDEPSDQPIPDKEPPSVSSEAMQANNRDFEFESYEDGEYAAALFDYSDGLRLAPNIRVHKKWSPDIYRELHERVALYETERCY